MLSTFHASSQWVNNIWPSNTSNGWYQMHCHWDCTTAMLTHWPLGDAAVILRMKISNSSYRLITLNENIKFIYLKKKICKWQSFCLGLIVFINGYLASSSANDVLMDGFIIKWAFTDSFVLGLIKYWFVFVFVGFDHQYSVMELLAHSDK